MNAMMTTSQQGDETICVGPCRVTGRPYRVVVRTADFVRWRDAGEYAQRAFPYLSAGDREFLISGTSPTGWAVLFPANEHQD